MTLEAEMMEQDVIGILIKNKDDVTAEVDCATRMAKSGQPAKKTN